MCLRRLILNTSIILLELYRATGFGVRFFSLYTLWSLSTQFPCWGNVTEREVIVGNVQEREPTSTKS
jgi:hypothetical protein